MLNERVCYLAVRVSTLLSPVQPSGNKNINHQHKLSRYQRCSSCTITPETLRLTTRPILTLVFSTDHNVKFVLWITTFFQL